MIFRAVFWVRRPLPPRLAKYTAAGLRSRGGKASWNKSPSTAVNCCNLVLPPTAIFSFTDITFENPHSHKLFWGKKWGPSSSNAECLFTDICNHAVPSLRLRRQLVRQHRSNLHQYHDMDGFPLGLYRLLSPSFLHRVSFQA